MNKKEKKSYLADLDADLRTPVRGGSKSIPPEQRCSGWKGGVHERSPHDRDRCRWCWQPVYKEDTK